ncbi:MAG: NosD domain-containing protein [Thermoplasmatota archaeon]
MHFPWRGAPSISLLLVSLLILPLLQYDVEGTDKPDIYAPRTWIVDKKGDGDFTTIQDAVDSASDGDTIRVWDGKYVENVNVNIRVDLVGNGSSTTVIDGNREFDLDTIVLGADSINFTGFNVTNNGNFHQFGGIAVWGNSIRIYNNTCWGNQYGIVVWGQYNRIFDNNCSGNVKDNIHDGLYGGASHNTFENNNCSSSQTRYGIWLDRSRNNTVVNNTCINNIRSGICLFMSSYNNISGNIFSNSATMSGMHLYEAGWNNITGNNCSENHDKGIHLSMGSSNNMLSGNTILNNRDGIAVSGSSSSNSARMNSIFGNRDYGVNCSDNDFSMDARSNWWGSGTGPYHPLSNPAGEGDNVSDNVTFIPWLGGEPVNRPPEILTSILPNAAEDRPYSFTFSGADPDMDPVSWKMETNANWLSFEPSNRSIWGTPHNPDVGAFWLYVNLSDDKGAWSGRNFTLHVNNTPAEIIGLDMEFATEDRLYENDYDSTDDGEGGVFWELESNGTWLELDQLNGTIYGMPENKDVGSIWVNISVHDGNGGLDWHNFSLVVRNMNDIPEPLIDVLDIVIFEDGEAFVHPELYFRDVDGDPLIFTLDGFGNVSHEFLGNDTVLLAPSSDWSGFESYTLLARDRYEQVGIGLNITVLPLNDPPFDVSIMLLEDEYTENDSQKARGSAKDVDIPYGDELTFTWSTNSTGLIGTGRDIDLGLESGHYLLMLNVTDREGESTTTSVPLHVQPQYRPPPADDDEEPDDDDEEEPPATDDDDDEEPDDDDKEPPATDDDDDRGWGEEPEGEMIKKYGKYIPLVLILLVLMIAAIVVFAIVFEPGRAGDEE